MKSVNLKAIKHNLRHTLKEAAFAHDLSAVSKAAQAMFEAGYELEDMEYGPAMFDVIANAIVLSGWSPVLTDEMKRRIELQESEEGL